MAARKHGCPDCSPGAEALDRRAFLQTTAAAGVAAAGASLLLPAVARAADAAPKSAPETLVKQLFGSLTEEQK
ncbi:MAG: twin-arginine translocation signal domain-containing protein, partial [Planctomycetales bacterium]|nr:twin-arginine translocation signal domain-containing protein [Planctomycetales bacterium]